MKKQLYVSFAASRALHMRFCCAKRFTIPKIKKLSFIKSNGDSHGGTAEQYEAEEPVQQPFGAFDGGCRYQKLYACKRTSV